MTFSPKPVILCLHDPHRDTGAGKVYAAGGTRPAGPADINSGGADSPLEEAEAAAGGHGQETAGHSIHGLPGDLGCTWSPQAKVLVVSHNWESELGWHLP